MVHSFAFLTHAFSSEALEVERCFEEFEEFWGSIILTPCHIASRVYPTRFTEYTLSSRKAEALTAHPVLPDITLLIKDNQDYTTSSGHEPGAEVMC